MFVTVWVESDPSGVMRDLGYRKHPAWTGCNVMGGCVDGWQVPAEDVEALKELLTEAGAYFSLIQRRT